VSIVAASGLVAGTISSRIGLWGYDSCAHFIIHEVSAAIDGFDRARLISLKEVQGGHRGSFSSTEASFQNAFELLSYVTTIVWSHPSLSVSSLMERCCRVHVSIPVREFSAEKERTPCATASVYHT